MTRIHRIAVIATSICALGLALPATASAAPLTCDGKPATIVAPPGKWTYGTSGDDVIVAQNTSAKLGVYIDAGEGNDRVCGSITDDIVYGQGGDDLILTGDGNDRIEGQAGNDYVLAGGNGTDVIDGGSGKDRLYGEAGNDTLHGGPSGADILYGGVGDDNLSAIDGSRDDYINGGEGYDVGRVDFQLGQNPLSDAYAHIEEHHTR